LKTETAILRAVGGPADPFYLRTTKPETLILVTPAPIQPVTPAPGGNVVPAPLPAAPGKALPPTAPPAKPKGELGLIETEQDVIDLANSERKKAKLAPLKVDANLAKAARLHCANMAKQRVLSHTLDKKGVSDRITAAGYTWSRCGENIAQGQRTSAEAVRAWMNSPGHRANILARNYPNIGVAVVTAKDGQKYWTMVLARPR
jgi:uncharacterized protein YkwD